MKRVLALIMLLAVTGVVFAGEDENSKETNDDDTKTLTLSSFLNDVEISGNWFLSFQSNRIEDVTSNQFLLKRGYLTFKKNLNKNI